MKGHNATTSKTVPNWRSEQGFTLIELLVVLGIIALLMALVAPRVMRYLGDARSQTADVQLKNLESALELYYLDTGHYPSTESGLKNLVDKPESDGNWNGPYIKRKSGLTDPWGREYHYESPGKNDMYDIFSLGKDDSPGGEGENKDTTNW